MLGIRRYDGYNAVNPIAHTHREGEVMVGRAIAKNHLLSLMAFLLIQTGCGGGGKGVPAQNGGSGPGPSGKITLSGRFAPPTASDSTPGSASGTSVATITTVIIFDTNGNYSTAPVTNGAFAIPVDTAAPVGMIFAGAANNFLGYMTLGNGINSLPLTVLKDGTTSIDLQTLTASGNVFTPGHNPLGTDLPLTAQEQSAFAQCNSLFSAIVQNPDLDGNGAIDMLEGKCYRVFVSYGVKAMSFNGALTPTLPGALSIQYFNLSVMTTDLSDSGPATVTGPVGSGLVNAACSVSVQNTQLFYNVYPNLGSSPTPVPMAGTYVFRTALGKTLTIAVPDQSSANARIVVAVPTVTPSAGNVNRIDWVYKTVGNNNAIAPAAVINTLIVSIDHPLGSRSFNSSNLPSSITSLTLTNLAVPWDSSTCLYMAYNDVFDNHYVVSFNNQ
jgi:hypothetical protein